MDKAQGKIFRELPNTTLCDCGHPKTAHYQGEGCCEGCGCTWYHPNIGVIDMLKAGYRKLPKGEPHFELLSVTAMHKKGWGGYQIYIHGKERRPITLQVKCETEDKDNFFVDGKVTIVE